MHVNAIRIVREGYYGQRSGSANPSKPFVGTIKIQGTSSKMELVLDAGMSEKILAVIAEEVAAAGRRAAEALTAEAFTINALPAPKAA